MIVHNPTVNQVYRKAINMIQKSHKEQKKFMICLKAGICPTCGEELQIENDKKRPLFQSHIVCKKGCLLINPEGIDCRSISFSFWEDCINNTIRKAAVNA